MCLYIYTLCSTPMLQPASPPFGFTQSYLWTRPLVTASCAPIGFNRPAGSLLAALCIPESWGDLFITPRFSCMLLLPHPPLGIPCMRLNLFDAHAHSACYIRTSPYQAFIKNKKDINKSYGCMDAIYRLIRRNLDAENKALSS